MKQVPTPVLVELINFPSQYSLASATATGDTWQLVFLLPVPGPRQLHLSSRQPRVLMGVSVPCGICFLPLVSCVQDVKVLLEFITGTCLLRTVTLV